MRIMPAPTGLIPQARDPSRAGLRFLPVFRGLHPRLLVVCPFGATPTAMPFADFDATLTPRVAQTLPFMSAPLSLLI
jgi:hypothetical protein